MGQRIRDAFRRLRGEAAGFTVLEVVAALSILALGFAALASASGAGARLLMQARQRQVASDEASARLENLRSVPYDQVALSSTPTHSADSSDPDYDVDNGGNYDYGGDGSYEPLVAGGSVAHREGPYTVGSTVLDVYQYITWVDDPGVTGTQDYKRAVVVVTYSGAGNPGREHQVTVSTLMTVGTVTVGGSQAGATRGSPSPTPSPSPSPTGVCAGDTTAPGGTFTIVSGTGASEGYTSSTSVTLSLAPTDSCTPMTVRLSNDNVTYSNPFAFDAAMPTVSWSITAGEGIKHVWAQFADNVGNTSTVGPREVTLDSTIPTVPGTLTRSASCSGSNRTVTLSWGSATDGHLLGYRVYKQVNGGTFTTLTTTSTTTTSDTDSKGLASLAYKVVAYDAAGNEGNPTNVVTLSKNQCS